MQWLNEVNDLYLLLTSCQSQWLLFVLAFNAHWICVEMPLFRKKNKQTNNKLALQKLYLKYQQWIQQITILTRKVLKSLKQNKRELFLLHPIHLSFLLLPLQTEIPFRIHWQWKVLCNAITRYSCVLLHATSKMLCTFLKYKLEVLGTMEKSCPNPSFFGF